MEEESKEYKEGYEREKRRVEEMEERVGEMGREVRMLMEEREREGKE